MSWRVYITGFSSGLQLGGPLQMSRTFVPPAFMARQKESQNSNPSTEAAQHLLLCGSVTHRLYAADRAQDICYQFYTLSVQQGEAMHAAWCLEGLLKRGKRITEALNLLGASSFKLLLVGMQRGSGFFLQPHNFSNLLKDPVRILADPWFSFFRQTSLFQAV